MGHTSLALPGIGSYIAVAIEQKNLAAIGWAIAAMLVVIILYDQLLFRPLVAWADRLKFEQDATGRPPTSWALTVMQRSRLLSLITDVFRRSALEQLEAAGRETQRRARGPRTGQHPARSAVPGRWSSRSWRSDCGASPPTSLPIRLWRMP